jgi:hypothetical protein
MTAKKEERALKRKKKEERQRKKKDKEKRKKERKHELNLRSKERENKTETGNVSLGASTQRLNCSMLLLCYYEDGKFHLEPHHHAPC